MQPNLFTHAEPQIANDVPVGLTPPIPQGLTPMMQHYWQLKQQHADCLLFYRLGDFYELFFDDAVKAAEALSITLTRRGQKDGADIPMCGVPFHACDNYLAKLIKAGFRVAICEQLETPEQAKARGGFKAVVKRDVVRIVTPGTLTEDHLLSARQSNFLAALGLHKGQYALAWLDVSTGQNGVRALDMAQVAQSLAQLNPAEILWPQSQDILWADDHTSNLSATGLKPTLKTLPDTQFDSTNNFNRLCTHYNVQNLDGFGALTPAMHSALGVLLHYVQLTQANATHLHMQPPQLQHADNILHIDAATRRNLELAQTTHGQTKGSLLDSIDHCFTAMGARLLAQHMAQPLTDIAALNARYQSIAWLAQTPHATLQDVLKQYPDLERTLARVVMNRAGPRDLQNIQQAISLANQLHTWLKAQHNLPALVQSVLPHLAGTLATTEIAHTLTTALKTELPLLARDGGFLASGFDVVFDEYAGLQTNGRGHIAALQLQYQRQTGISSLKIKHNNILGFFAEVPSAQADKAATTPDPAQQNGLLLIHRQTMTTGTRFTSAALLELEKKINEASTRALQLELEHFDKFVATITQHRDSLAQMAQAIAMLDVAQSWAHLAQHFGYTQPTLFDDTRLNIVGGKHPVVAKTHKNFVANDCAVQDTQKLWLLTGPNMAGKSTFLKQNALIIILAQMGGFVPATQADIGVVDAIFSRIGAADDLAQGKSTFMVEMVETAAILNQATAKSFVILDEMGRGTATFDGLSLAWAVVEHLHNVVQCRTLFATHYHELTVLADTLANVACFTLQIKEWAGKIIFLHNIISGAASSSYGIHVAEMAGLPQVVTQRAAVLLQALNAQQQGGFVAPAETTVAQAMPETPAVLQELAALDLNNLTPLQALHELGRLKALLG